MKLLFYKHFMLAKKRKELVNHMLRACLISARELSERKRESERERSVLQRSVTKAEITELCTY